MTTLCANHGQQLVAVFLLTALAFGGCVQPQLQQGTTHSSLIQHPPAVAHNEPIPYPAAGYRPKIPFDLPRQPKVFFPLTTSMPTLITAPTEEIDINIETLDQTTTTTTITTTTMTTNASAHIPANNYGTPLHNNNHEEQQQNTNGTNVHVNVNVKVDLTETEVINAPTEHLQPPMPNAAKNFNTAQLNNTLDVVKDNVNISTEADVNLDSNSQTKAEADVDVDANINDENDVSQVLVATDESIFSVEPQPKLNVFNRRFEYEQRQIPASTYGVPNPDIGSIVSPDIHSHSHSTSTSRNDSVNANQIPSELEFNESENELEKIFIPNTSNSIHLSASNEALNRLSALKTGRLILLPTDNAADILHQIYLANFANIKREH